MAEKQEELFNDFKDSNAPKRAFGKGVFPEKTFTMIFTYERLILTALVLVIILVASFVFGFERGRKNILQRQALTQPAVKTVAPITNTKTQEITRHAITQKTIQKPYTILFATYKSKELAQQEVDKLRKLGLTAPVVITINQKGLYEIFVGQYANQKDALPMLNALRKIHKDCDIRKR